MKDPHDDNETAYDPKTRVEKSSILTHREGGDTRPAWTEAAGHDGRPDATRVVPGDGGRAGDDRRRGEGEEHDPRRMAAGRVGQSREAIRPLVFSEYAGVDVAANPITIGKAGATFASAQKSSRPFLSTGRDGCEHHEPERSAMTDTTTTAPWLNEPDDVSFEHAGFPCLVKRHPSLKHLCGYVGLPETHACYGKSYDESEVESVRVHGGMTFAEAGNWSGKHADAWWFGFDCGHFGDLSPKMLDYSIQAEETYRDIAFVRGEVERLAEQLAALAAATGTEAADAK